MKIDNPLSKEYLITYPSEAARVLEQVSTADVAALFADMPVLMAAPVIASMLPERAAICMSAMPAMSAANLLAELSASSAARIFRLFSVEQQAEITARLSDKMQSRMHSFLRYPSVSVGALLEPTVTMLTENLTVAEAIRQIERLGRATSCDVYLIDDKHHLVGMVDLGKLLTSKHHVKLRDVMSRKTQPISVRATLETLLAHPGWSTRRRLPVVDKDNTLLGTLDHSKLQQAVGEMDSSAIRDPIDNILSLLTLYWLSAAQLLDNLLGATKPVKGERP